MVKRKRVARLPEATTHASDDEGEDEMTLTMTTAFAQAVAQFTAQEATDYPDWGTARELAFHSSGGKTDKPAYLLDDKASELPTRPGRKSAKKAKASFKGEFPQALHRSWAAFLVYKLAYERRNSVRLEMDDETSVVDYNSKLSERVSGRTRGTGGDQKSELPPELNAWRRVFRCSRPEDEEDNCTFGFTATVEFVGNEYMVRVADGVFQHSHKLPPVNDELQQLPLATESLSQGQADTGSPLLRAATSGSTRTFLDSPPTPPTDDGRLTRGIYLAVRPVANAIIDELMEWKEEYFLSELGNLRDYLTRLQQRGREEARRNPVSPVGYDSPLDAVRFTFPFATTQSPDPPLYSRLPRASWAATEDPAANVSTPSTISTPVTEARVVATAQETSESSSASQRRTESQSARAIASVDTRRAVTKATAKAAGTRRSKSTERSPRSAPTASTTNKSRSRRRRASIDSAVHDRPKRQTALSGTDTEGDKMPRATRRSARSASSDHSSAEVSTTSNAAPDDASESSQASKSVETTRRSRDSSMPRKKTRPPQASGQMAEATQEIPAKRRRLLQTETTSPPKSKSSRPTSETVVVVDTPTEGQARTNVMTSDSVPATVASEIAEPTPSINTDIVEVASETSPVPEKSPEETAETAAPPTKSTDSTKDAISTTPVDQPTVTLKASSGQLTTAANGGVATTTDQAPKRRSRLQAPAPLSVVTEIDSTVDLDTTSNRRKSPRDRAVTAAVASPASKASKTPARGSSNTRSPRVAAPPTSKTSLKSVASIDQWLAKMKPSTNTTMKKQKKPKSSQTPVEMFSRFSRDPPLHSFRGQIPATTTSTQRLEDDDDGDWDVILVPRSSKVLPQPATAEGAAPKTPPPPPEPSTGEVLL